mmetsp:Transcript_45971/g.74987  ORF Transcript_45971/g.74987 Transcript_45971/m.74987 type:complete len:105 (+) Transcript_45971:91-405(+)|eukprot:CAMPEP_0184645400 /NCGR_PEP_ID=MMETSP0308-20130426/1855_1 /TAXON_ID=38269 /ORGANISM="Gloeochaete witrockiana, Strain SAG 46.84" /LENGTH=104 /DNA_ID=CAMNT_0027074335 /DNA_START=87 /DNA_END=401 /DNA_ORIENTATION=+
MADNRPSGSSPLPAQKASSSSSSRRNHNAAMAVPIPFHTSIQTIAQAMREIDCEDDQKLMRECENMGPYALGKRLRELEEWAVSLGIDQGKEIQRGRLLNILER